MKHTKMSLRGAKRRGNLNRFSSSHCEGKACGNLTRILAILLSLVMLLGVLPLTAFAEDVDTAATGDGKLTITKPLEDAAINHFVSYNIYPYLRLGVSGGSGDYTFEWYRGEDEFDIGTKVATTTVSEYQATSVGYYRCWVRDANDYDNSVLTDSVHVIQESGWTVPATDYRINGTRVEWKQSRIEDEIPSGKVRYSVVFYRLDTTHAIEDIDYNIVVEKSIGSDNISIYQERSGHYYSLDYPVEFDNTKKIYSFDMKDIVISYKDYDDIKYEIVFYYAYIAEGEMTRMEYRAPSFEYDLASSLYNGTVFKPALSELEHDGEVFIEDKQYSVGDTLYANINGGRWKGKNPTIKWQRMENGTWADIGATGISYQTVSTDIGHQVRCVAESPYTGRFSGEVYFDDECFVSNSAEINADACTVSFNPNGGSGSMESVTVAKGSAYTLPECTFTPPEGKVFDKWLEGLFTNYAPGDSFIVNEDTTIRAIWKNAGSGGLSISGKVTSFLDSSEITTVTLSKKKNDEYQYVGMRTVSGDVASISGVDYRFSGLSSGQYQLTVSKKNHVARKYDVTLLFSSKTQDVKICPIGDANNDGSVKANDAMVAYRHAQGKTMITDEYKFKCANFAGNDDYVKANDAMMIYRQAQGKHSLF